jgi:hypothetical protein
MSRYLQKKGEIRRAPNFPSKLLNNDRFGALILCYSADSSFDSSSAADTSATGAASTASVFARRLRRVVFFFSS